MNNKQDIDQHETKANLTNKKKAGIAIGGGLVGAAIGGLLGRRVGGVSGAVVGVVAGAFIGKGTAERVNSTVECLMDTAKSVANNVNHNVNSVGNTLKDTLEEVKPSVVSAVEAAKDTVEAVKPSIVSVVSAATSVGEGVNHSIKDVGNTVKDTVEAVTPSVIDAVATAKDTVDTVKVSFIDVVEVAKNTIEEVKLSLSNLTTASDVNQSVDDSAQDVGVHTDTVEETPSVIAVEEAIAQPTTEVSTSVMDEDKHVQLRLEEFQPIQPETIQQPQQQRIQLPTIKIAQLAGILIVGSAILTSIGVTWGFNSKKLLKTKTLSSNMVAPTVEKRAEISADGWIFLGNVNNVSTTMQEGNPLIEGSQSTNSPVVPSVGAIVTVTATPGLTLRANRPKEPNYNYQEQKALAVIKQNEKLKIIKIEFVKPNRFIQTATTWAKVDRCGQDCR
ncbi:hypothetical protein [Iningainema tapete]|uniref:17 kDa surface antigen n=1 Tax=Iningainema tapete BLCC-T55 TaxID=2748662 RepID=A0A8J7C700_9CYAN|nr:hypothetical protein [Iningainema tapete]MBD2775004.1 hypothetical protein [Iningainema tapete BLCC-T55]